MLKCEGGCQRMVDEYYRMPDGKIFCYDCWRHNKDVAEMRAIQGHNQRMQIQRDAMAFEQKRKADEVRLEQLDHAIRLEKGKCPGAWSSYEDDYNPSYKPYNYNEVELLRRQRMDLQRHLYKNTLYKAPFVPPMPDLSYFTKAQFISKAQSHYFETVTLPAEKEAARKAEQARIKAEKERQRILEEERVKAEQARIKAEKERQRILEEKRVKAEQARIKAEQAAAGRAELERIKVERARQNTLNKPKRDNISHLDTSKKTNNGYIISLIILGIIIIVGLIVTHMMSNDSYTRTSNSTYTSHYFSLNTVFYAETPTTKNTVTYYPNGNCSSIGYILNEGYWMKGTSQGKYYIKNNTIYVTWDGEINERYNIVNNSYTDNGLCFKRK